MHVPITGTAALIGGFMILIYILYRVTRPVHREVDEEFDRGYAWACAELQRPKGQSLRELDDQCWASEEPFDMGVMARVYEDPSYGELLHEHY